jgi:hypothetical protein
LRGPNLSFKGVGVGAGVGAAMGFGVERGTNTAGVGDFGVAPGAVASGGSVVTGGTNALVGDGVAVGPGLAGVAAGAGVGVLGFGVFGLEADIAGRARTGAGPTGSGVPPGLTVVDDPAGTETSAPPALVSTVPVIVTTVV